MREKYRSDPKRLMRANDGLKAEILERKRFEATLQLANRKLNTLSTITRHDILNQITAIVMYVSLAEERVKDPALLEHLRKIEQSTQIIQKQIRFARDYQDIGLHAPQWQNVDLTIRNAMAGLDLGGVRVDQDVGTLELYADLLLERVFSSIMDNTVRHGQKATQIRFSDTGNERGIDHILPGRWCRSPCPGKRGNFQTRLSPEYRVRAFPGFRDPGHDGNLYRRNRSDRIRGTIRNQGAQRYIPVHTKDLKIFLTALQVFFWLGRN